MDLTKLSDTLSLIPLNHSLGSHVNIGIVIKVCADSIKSFPDYFVLKSDIELLVWLARSIKAAFHLYSLGTKQEQDDAIVAVMTQAFSLSPLEIEALKRAILFLRNNKMIKKIPLLSKAFACITKKN